MRLPETPSGAMMMSSPRQLSINILCALPPGRHLWPGTRSVPHRQGCDQHAHSAPVLHPPPERTAELGDTPKSCSNRARQAAAPAGRPCSLLHLCPPAPAERTSRIAPAKPGALPGCRTAQTAPAWSARRAGFPRTRSLYLSVCQKAHQFLPGAGWDALQIRVASRIAHQKRSAILRTIPEMLSEPHPHSRCLCRCEISWPWLSPSRMV